MKTILPAGKTKAWSRDRAMQPIKVCMHVMGTARTDNRVMREATALVAEGFSVSIVDIESQRTRIHEEEMQGIRIKHIIMPGWFIPARFKPWFLVKAAQVLMRGTWQLLRTPADIYHVHEEQALPACYIVAKLRQKKLIFDAHELPLSGASAKRWPWLHTLSKHCIALMLRHCAGVVTVSPPIAQELSRHYTTTEVCVIRNVPLYRNVPKSNRLRQHLDLASHVRIALYQGNIQPDRGLDRLIRAAAFLAEDIIIVIMGKGSKSLISELESLIVSEGVGDRVKLLPPVPYQELLDWTVSADIGLIVYAPDYELNILMCLPNKFFEYLMVGLPVLASRLDAIVEIIKAHGIGQVVPSLAPEDIGAAINGMMVNPEALTEMHHKALEVAQEYCWEKESQRLIRLYYDVLSVEETQR